MIPTRERAHLPTEKSLEHAAGLDRMATDDAFDVFDREDRSLCDAIARAKPEICAAIERVVECLGSGGRLIYVGAGTSGRLGVLDAVECPPTFQSHPRQVQGRLAGGHDALLRAIEGAEDDPEAGADTVADVDERDLVFGIAAGGTTPFVHGALRAASERGAATCFLACVPRELVDDEADVSIRLGTGPEVLAGSTRLKAATATKLVLNRVTTIAFARLGKVYDNLMVDVATGGNRKLADRGRRLVAQIAGLDEEAAGKWLARAEGRVKVACVMQRHGIDAPRAQARLEACGGFLREALAEHTPSPSRP